MIGKLKDRINILEKELQKVKQLCKCLQGQHDLRFYYLGESTVKSDYYIQHACASCGKIFQRPLNEKEKEALSVKGEI